MKKILSLVLSFALVAVMASCSDNNKKGSDTVTEGNDATQNEVVNNESTVYENADLLALADSLYASFNADELPMLGSMEISAEDFEFFTFIPYEDGLKAVVSEPMMGSIAHSVVLVETPDAETAKKIADDMKANANPRKWICVEAEKVVTETNGNIAILVMSDAKADKIVEAFKAVTVETMPVLGETVEGDVEIEETPEEDATGVQDEETAGEPDIDVDVETVPEVEDVPAVNPEVPEVEELPAVMPEVDDTPAVMPEVDDTPAVMPGVDIPAVMPEIPEVEDTPEVESPVVDNGSIDELYALADKLYNGINPEDMPMVGTMELNEENFEYSAFVPYKSSYLAVESMPMMGSTAHSVVIVKAATSEEAAQLANDMKTNANPRKWICVSARSVKSASKGQYAILVMTSYEVMPSDSVDETQAEELSNEKSEERANIIINNFLAAV